MNAARCETISESERVVRSCSVDTSKEPANFWGRLFGDKGRGRRVAILLIGIVLLSLADLLITLTHLRSVGMVEANPIAAYLVRTTNSAWVLSAYKVATVGVCVALLFALRRRLEGEIAAWTSVVILACMCVIWHRYTQDLAEIQALAQAGVFGESWLHLD